MTLPIALDNPVASTYPISDAQVVVSPVPADGNSANFIEAIEAAGVFTDYRIIHRYENDGHVYMAGITSPGGFQGNKAAFFKLASDTLLWIADWTAARLGSQPEVPKPTALADQNWVLLDRIIEVRNVVVGPDGVSPLYRITGTYVYGQKSPSDDVFDDVEYPKPPWLDSTGIQRRVVTGSVVDGLIEIRE
ncbi:MAG: hypothetical protein Q7O66_07885 [Dehalococcoidia bacterium]|nr:hypothetical protein [Dehalococcoidia bacterium]